MGLTHLGDQSLHVGIFEVGHVQFRELAAETVRELVMQFVAKEIVKVLVVQSVLDHRVHRLHGVIGSECDQENVRNRTGPMRNGDQVIDHHFECE